MNLLMNERQEDPIVAALRAVCLQRARHARMHEEGHRTHNPQQHQHNDNSCNFVQECDDENEKNAISDWWFQ